MSLFKDFDYSKFKKTKLPKDDSLQTLKEIKEIDKLNTDEKFIKKHDDVVKSFSEVVGDKESDYMQTLIDDSAPVILKLKKYYNRPRPKQNAKIFGIELKDIELKSMKTPSYPSGHSAQGYLVSEMLKDKYPNKKIQIDKVAKNISDSRNIAKAHYKSDSEQGKKLGLEMANFIKNQKQNG